MRWISALLCVLALTLSGIASPADAQQTQSFYPTGKTSLAVTTASARVPFTSAGPTVVVTNTGANTAYVAFGTNSITALATDFPINPGCTATFNMQGRAYMAGITAAGASALTLTTGQGIPTLQPTSCGNPAAPAVTGDLSGTVTAGGTFQTVAAAATTRRSIEFFNVCILTGSCTATTNFCYLHIGAGAATVNNSLAIQPGWSYLRSAGNIPSDALQIACDGTGDHFTLYTQ